MSDPTKPDIDYSYAGFQQENQDFPFPGTQLDNDLDNLSNSIDETIDALADIRRPDGQLQNSIVTADSLDESLLIGLKTPTVWAVSTRYAVLDTVIAADGIYRCIVSHESADFDEDFTAGYWELIFELSPTVPGNLPSYQFVGDGATLDWPIGVTPGSINNVFVSVGGSFQITNEIALVPGSPIKIRISPAVPVGVKIEIRTLVATLALLVPADGSVGLPQLSPDVAEKLEFRRYVADTLADAATMDLFGADVVTVDRYSASTPFCPADYVRVAQPANVEPSHAGKFQCMDGAWFELSPGAQINMEMLGANPDGNFGATAHTDGADNTTAVTAALAVAAFFNRPIQLLGIYRVAAMTMTLTEKVTIIGGGPTTGFVCPVYEDDVGIWDKAGCDLSYFRVHVTHMQAKLPDSGQLHACVLVSARLNTLSLEADDIGVSGFNHHHLTLTRRAVVVGGGGSGWYGIGNVNNGYVGDLDDLGSTAEHSNLAAFHWGGKSVGYGFAVTKTWHPHDNEVGALTAYQSQICFSPSAVYNLLQRGVMKMYGGLQLLSILPGDETDDFADTSVHPVGSVGKGIRLLGPFEHHDPTSTTEASVEIYSQGTSSGWRTMPDNPAVNYMGDLDMDVEIGDIALFGATLAAQGVVDAKYYRGLLKVGNVKLVNSNPVVAAVYWHDSQAGRMIVKSISGTLRYRAAMIDNASGFTLQDSAFTCTDVDTSTKVGFYAIGITEARVASGVHAVGLTKLTLTAGISQRMSRNTPIVVGGATVYTTGYNPPGMTVIAVTPLPALAGGEAVVIDHGCRHIDATLGSTGGFYHADLSRVQGVIKGKGKRARAGGIRMRTGSISVVEGFQFEATGFGLAAGVAIDLVVEDASETYVKAVGCTFGLDKQPLMNHCVQATTADGTKRRVTLVGCHFAGYNTAPVSASSANNWTAIGCTDKAGALFTNP